MVKQTNYERKQVLLSDIKIAAAEHLYGRWNHRELGEVTKLWFDQQEHKVEGLLTSTWKRKGYKLTITEVAIVRTSELKTVRVGVFFNEIESLFIEFDSTLVNSK